MAVAADDRPVRAHAPDDGSSSLDVGSWIDGPASAALLSLLLFWIASLLLLVRLLFPGGLFAPGTDHPDSASRACRARRRIGEYARALRSSAGPPALELTYERVPGTPRGVTRRRDPQGFTDPGERKLESGTRPVNGQRERAVHLLRELP